MCLPPLREPGNAARDARLERDRRLPVEQAAGTADVGDVPGHLAEERRRERDVGCVAGRLADQLRDPDERVALTVGEVDRLVAHVAADEAVDAPDDSLDAVVDVGEVEHLVVAAEDGDRLAPEDPVREEWDHPDHASEVVVEAPVDVGESEDDVRQLVAARVGVDERLTRDLRCRVRALRVGEVGGSLFRLEAMDVAVDLTARAEDDRRLRLPAMLEDVERHRHVLERTSRLADELMHLGVRGEVDDDVRSRVFDASDAAFHGGVMPREVLQQVAEVVRPGVQPLVDAEDVVAVGEEAEREVGADLPTRAGDEHAHSATIPRVAA